MRQSVKKLSIFFLLLTLTAMTALTGCGNNQADTASPSAGAASTTEAKQPDEKTKNDIVKKYGEHPVAKIELENGKTITFEMYPEIAPMSVKHVIENIESKYYDGKIFHRVIKNFMIQGGSSDGKGIGGSGRTVKGEFAANGFPNDLKHEPGVVSLARTQVPDSASGQFFICQGKASSHLDGQYAAFGRVTEGMDVVNEIASVPVDSNDMPLEPVVMKSITMVKE